MNAIDTNILVYARDPRDPVKPSTADALLVAACLEAGVTRLYTEDFDKAVEAEGIEIVNPFVAP